jgi:hypothetical protein
MPIGPHWDALRRPLRSCAIGAVPLLAFLAVWQFLVPGGGDSSPIAAWAFLIAGSACLSCGFGLAVSATRRLWRSTRRALSVLPGVFLVAVVVALPSAAGAAEAHGLIWLGSLLLALLLSAAFSAYLIVSAKDAAPIPSPPTSFDNDEPNAYARDIPNRHEPR